MRYAVISDVHATVAALDAVFARLDAARVERVVCLGDTVGYHAHPNECVARIRARCDVVIAGNHDRAAAGTLDPSEFPAGARRAIAWTRGVLAPAHAAYLAALPGTAAIDAATMAVHAALAPEPNDQLHVLSPERVAENLAALAARDERVCWFGHTHRPVVHAWRAGAIASWPGASAIELDPDTRYFVNPGSVGQPRDGDPRASCAIVDDDRITWLRVEFDVAVARRAAVAAGLAAPRWREVLARARRYAMRSRQTCR